MQVFAYKKMELIFALEKKAGNSGIFLIHLFTKKKKSGPWDWRDGAVEKHLQHKCKYPSSNPCNPHKSGVGAYLDPSASTVR